jgi:hypothetical protein
MSIAQDLMRRGALRLKPGVYSLRGEMHIDADELLRAEGIEPSAANQDTLERAARRACAGLGIPVDAEGHER